MCRVGQFWIPLSKNLSSHCKKKNLNCKANMHLDSKRCMSFTVLEKTQSSAKIKLCGSAMVTDHKCYSTTLFQVRSCPIPLLAHSRGTPRAILHRDPGMSGEQEQGTWAKQGKHKWAGKSLLLPSKPKLLQPRMVQGDNLRKIKEGIRYLEGFDMATNVCTGHS